MMKVDKNVIIINGIKCNTLNYTIDRDELLKFTAYLCSGQSCSFPALNIKYDLETKTFFINNFQTIIAMDDRIQYSYELRKLLAFSL